MSKRITNTKKGGAKKVIATIAAILVVALVVGVVAVYNVIDSGLVQRNQVAMKSDNYEVSSAMMSYYLNTLYQSTSSTYSSLGLDTSKNLSSQAYPGGGTWYDFYLDMAKSNVRQLLVLCEAAKADKNFKLDENDEHSADATLKEIETMAKLYGVTLDYYLEVTYGKGVNEKVFKQCYELSEIASHYSEYMTESYEFKEADWDKYYEDNKDEFNKVNYYSYEFDVDDHVAKGATDDDKKAVAARLDTYATELAKVTSADEFKAYVENYLKTDLYKDKTEEDLKKDKIDIAEIVADCYTEGATNSSESDLNKWLFDKETKANTAKIIKDKDGYSFNVAFIVPAEGSDLENECLYRDTYQLKSFRYIPFLTSSYNKSAKDAKAAAEKTLKEYQDKATEDNFAAIADKFANTSYAGGLVEGADKGAIGENADKWLYDSARKAGDVEIIEVEDSGYYLIYYVGDYGIKWQAQADNALISDKYDEEYSALAKTYTVMVVNKGLGLVSDINVG